MVLSMGFIMIPGQNKNFSLRKGNREALFPAHHLAGRQKEYCHMEQLSNLDKIPKPFGFKVACFPINIAGASGGWVRPVAIIEE